MIITISGTAGSGKDTVGKKVAKDLKYKFYSMGDLRGEMALKRGMTIEEFNRLGEKEDWTDREVDNYQRELGQKSDNFVIVGRTSFHFIPHSVKVFLDVDVQTAAKRIMGDKRPDEKYKSIDEAIKKLEERQKSDNLRYKKYYNLDILDKKHYDVCIDTSEMKPEEVASAILRYVKMKS